MMKLRVEPVVVHDAIDVAADVDGFFNIAARPARIAFAVPGFPHPPHGMRQCIGVPVEISLPHGSAIAAVVQGAAEHALKLVGASVAIGDYTGNALIARINPA